MDEPNTAELTPLQILDETVEWYRTHPFARAFPSPGSGGGCYYRALNGAECAVGRCFDWDCIPATWFAENGTTKSGATAVQLAQFLELASLEERNDDDEERFEERLEEMGFEGIEEMSIPEGAKGLDDILLPRYRGHSVEFWQDLQNLHDNAKHWDPSADGKHHQLSEKGLSYVQDLRVKYREEPKV